LIAGSVYSLATLPLALHYLEKEQFGLERFGLWTLMSSIAGYLSLIDLGMSNSVARLLIDHKDDLQTDAYSTMIRTGWLVLTVQALIILAAGFAIAPALGQLLRIPPYLQHEFVVLVRWQTGILAFGFFVRIFSHLLYAHQRMDVINYGQMLMLAVSFVAMWVFFAKFRQGVFSLVWGGALGTLSATLLVVIVCLWLQLVPSGIVSCRASWPQFVALFAYGKDMFLIAVGGQLILASQSMVITNRLGLNAAAVWYAGTRVLNLLNLALWRVCDSAGPGLSEMIARGEQTLLRDRFKTIVVLTASISGFAAVSYVLCNSNFVWVWTSFSKHSPVSWPASNDILLGVWVVVSAILHCHNSLVALTKEVRFMRYIFFLEGLVFVTAAWLAARPGGLFAVIVCSVLCSVIFSGSYGLWRVTRYFHVPLREVALNWQIPMLKVVAVCSPLALAAWWLGVRFDPFVRLAIGGILSASLGCYVLLRFGLPKDFQRELLQRAPRQINPLLRWVFVGITS
jgi:O-antigen/teichoic acid export membrane protein